MKRLLIITALAALISLPMPALCAEMGISGGYDLDRLLEQAENSFSFSENDAVFLLSREMTEITESGNLETVVHTVVRIGSRSSIRSYADLRIPYNSANSEFTTLKLRTWMDERWWPDPQKISQTAVVYTLPPAVAQASDYNSMREIMLLHDGVELPCVMETEYRITERGGAERVPGGFEILALNDPAVLVERIVSVPAGTDLKFSSGNGAGEPEIRKAGGRTEYIWRAENIDRLGSPRISAPSSYAPYMVWSAEGSWEELGRKVSEKFDEAASLNAALADTVREITEAEPSDAAEARSILEYIIRNTRSIHYHPGFWFPSPRPATRVWETAYGHALDRAVIAAAMLREAGLKAHLMLLSDENSVFQNEVPQAEAFDRIMLKVEGGSFTGFFDPAGGKLHEGINNLYGKTVWIPEAESAPELFSGPEGGADPSVYRLSINLARDEGGWEGTGFIHTSGLFCSYHNMAGPGGKGSSYIDRLAGTILTGAEGYQFSPEVLDREQAQAEFKIRIESATRDHNGRIRLILGEKPDGGIMSNLPSSLHPAHNSRTSPVILPSGMFQSITVRIETGGLKPVRLPESRKIENGAGSFNLSAEQEEGYITIRRELRLDKEMIPAGSWPLLRELLLEETDARARTVIME